MGFEGLFATLHVGLLLAGLSVAFTASAPAGMAAGWTMAAIGAFLLTVHLSIMGWRAWRAHDASPMVTAESILLRKQIGNTDMAVVAVLAVTNHPKGPNSPIAQIVPHIEFIDAARPKALRLVGRWGDDKLPAHPDEHFKQIEIAPGVTRYLDLAIKFDKDAVQTWYALDQWSVFDGYRKAEYELTLPVLIIIHLVGTIDEKWATWIEPKPPNGFSIQTKLYPWNRCPDE